MRYRFLQMFGFPKIVFCWSQGLVLLLAAVVGNTMSGQEPTRRIDSQKTEQELSADEKRETVQNLCALLEENYVFPEMAERIVQYLEQQEKSGGYEKMLDSKEFAAALTRDIRSINDDRHLRVWMTPPQAATDETNLGTEFSRSRGKHSNYGFEEVKILAGNIGYIKMSSFSLDQLYADSQGPASAAMRFVNHTDAIIFDLRDNSGGSPRLSRYLSSFLYTSEPVHLNDYYFRTSDSTLEYWTLPTVDGKRMPDVKVFILINGGTFSAAEGFAYNLKHLDRATIVGETSGGGAHGGSTHSVTAKFQAYIPYSRSIHPVTKTDFEGVGVLPDVKVESSNALLTSHILAIEHLSGTQLNELHGDLYATTLESLEADLNPIELTDSDREKFVGIYQIAPQKSLTITMNDEGQLFGQMTGDERKVAVSPITNLRFRVDDYQVEFTFEKDSMGEVVGLTIHQGNGLKAKKVNK